MKSSKSGGLLLVTTYTLLAGLAAASELQDLPIDIGRAIYERNVGRDLITVSIAGSEFRRADATFSCAACHGPSGAGGSEGNVAAPSLVRSRIDATTLRAALVRHRGPDGGSLGMTMPRYRMSADDLVALATYVVALPNPPVPGISADNIRITIDPTGSGLSAASLALLSSSVEETMKKVNDSGGIYGRRLALVLAMPDQRTTPPAFITLRWTAGAAGEMALSIRGRAPEPVCGSLELDNSAISTAVERISQTTPASPVEKTGSSAPSPADKRSHIILDSATDSIDRQLAAARNVDEVYLLPGTATPALIKLLGGRARLVVPGDLAARAEAARQWMGHGQSGPHDAIVLATFDEGLVAIVSQLRTAGRRLFAGRYCQALKAAVEQAQKLTIIHGDEVIVLPVTERATNVP